MYEDLDIDSLDAADLVPTLREITGLKEAPVQFRKVRTVGDVVDTIHALAAGRDRLPGFRTEVLISLRNLGLL